jgi:hypothetical protein
VIRKQERKKKERKANKKEREKMAIYETSRKAKSIILYEYPFAQMLNIISIS